MRSGQPPSAGPRVVVERLDDRAGQVGLAAADDGLLGRLVDSMSELGSFDADGSSGEISFAFDCVEVDNDESNIIVVAAEPAAEEACSRLVGGTAESATRGSATGIIGGGGDAVQVRGQHLSINHQQHQQHSTTTMDTISPSSTSSHNLDLDTPTTENILEALWPEVSNLGDETTGSWSDHEFDLLFPDLV